MNPPDSPFSYIIGGFWVSHFIDIMGVSTSKKFSKYLFTKNIIQLINHNKILFQQDSPISLHIH